MNAITTSSTADDELIAQAIMSLKLSPRALLELSCDLMDLGRAVLAAERARPDRHVLQAEGKHPPPCARFCEATAFQIENRMLRRQLEEAVAKNPKPKCAYCRGRGRVDRDFVRDDGSSYTMEIACPRCDS